MITMLTGDCREVLCTLSDASVHCVVTSPPYWGLRDYGVDGQLGLEPDFNAYVAGTVAVFREVRRVLRADGTLWLNLGDSYARDSAVRWDNSLAINAGWSDGRTMRNAPNSARLGLKPKDLCGIPWRVAFALQADGWYLRQDIIWSKPNPMPESVTDRCTKAHEYLFLLSKRERYYYDAEAIREPISDSTLERWRGIPEKLRPNGLPTYSFVPGEQTCGVNPNGRNKRSVWEVTTQPFSEAHFATFPPALIEPCIKAGTSEKGCCGKCGKPWVRQSQSRIEHSQAIHNGTKYGGIGQFQNQAANRHRDGHIPGHRVATTIGWSPSCSCAADPVPCTVLDPFAGAGTTGLVADRLQRNAILIELNPAYAAMAEGRIIGDAPLFVEMAP